jgi:hypothetical protein
MHCSRANRIDLNQSGNCGTGLYKLQLSVTRCSQSVGERRSHCAGIEERALIAGLPGATLELVDGGDHSLARTAAQERKAPAIEPVLDRAAAWMRKMRKL